MTSTIENTTKSPEADVLTQKLLASLFQNNPQSRDQLTASISSARHALLKEQKEDGHWCFELEADCTIPAEYVLMMHFLDEIDEELQNKIAVYLCNKQNKDGSWPLYHAGKGDISCSVKAYYALKLAGKDVNDPVMKIAREWILAQGGAAKANVFTRLALAMFKQVPWRAVPYLPVEVMLLPRWFPFHLSKVSYWSRTVMVPLFILYTLKATAKNPKQIDVTELFIKPAEKERHYFSTRGLRSRLFLWAERLARLIVEPLIPAKVRQRAMKKAEQWFTARLNGEDGLGGIFPAMVNAYEALILLGYKENHPYRQQAKLALQRLLVIKEKEAYCQPCFSPVWDTGLSALALYEDDPVANKAAIQQGLDWLKERQILSGPADWQSYNPDLKPGGWAFFYNNSYYPDLDDTAVVAWAMQIADSKRYTYAINRAADWLAGMQSKNGGFASYDKDNTYHYLNEIPFADHKALLDPPTSDVSARCATFFALANRQQDQQTLERCLAYLLAEQEENGSWFGRWGTNYIYGTWSTLLALESAGVKPEHSSMQRAAAWLKSYQQADGGWGESNDSYEPHSFHHQPSTAYQTAWALLGLMAAGEVNSDAVKRGVAYLMRTQRNNGLWQDPYFTAPGFPRVFYLNYHGYSKFFPLWALARYRSLTRLVKQ